MCPENPTLHYGHVFSLYFVKPLFFQTAKAFFLCFHRQLLVIKLFSDRDVSRPFFLVLFLCLAAAIPATRAHEPRRNPAVRQAHLSSLARCVASFPSISVRHLWTLPEKGSQEGKRRRQSKKVGLAEMLRRSAGEQLYK